MDSYIRVVLDQDDIKRIIAKEFKSDDVTLELYTTIEGYGRDERYAAKIRAIVKQPAQFDSGEGR